jgi:hypothetical protein
MTDRCGIMRCTCITAGALCLTLRVYPIQCMEDGLAACGSHGPLLSGQRASHSTTRSCPWMRTTGTCLYTRTVRFDCSNAALLPGPHQLSRTHTRQCRRHSGADESTQLIEWSTSVLPLAVRKHTHS